MSLLRHPAAVDGIGRAGDAGGGVAGEEHGERADILRLGELVHRLLRRQQRDLRFAHRLAGCLGAGVDLLCFCTNGVSTQPGQMALQVMPSFAVSIATTLVRPTKPCLAAT